MPKVWPSMSNVWRAWTDTSITSALMNLIQSTNGGEYTYPDTGMTVTCGSGSPVFWEKTTIGELPGSLTTFDVPAAPTGLTWSLGIAMPKTPVRRAIVPTTLLPNCWRSAPGEVLKLICVVPFVSHASTLKPVGGPMVAVLAVQE